MATVRQSTGDYPTLNAALAASEAIINIDQAWTISDIVEAIFLADASISISGPAMHPGYWNPALNHYRLVTTGTGHSLELSGAFTATIDGIAIEQGGTSTSSEVFRCVPGASDSVTIKNSLLRCSTNSNQQDCIYTGFNTTIGPVTIEQCILWGANRAGLHVQNNNGNATVNVNSSTIWGNALGGGSTDGGIRAQQNTGTVIINVQNSLVVGNKTGAGEDFDQSTANITWNISNSISSDATISALLDSGSGNLENKTPSDDAGAGANSVVFQNITSAPYDLRLKEATTKANNSAHDMHATKTAHSLSIPDNDIVGTARPQNTNYECGAFEIVSGAPPATNRRRRFLVGAH
jgi:hypothetical protein